MGFFNVTRGRSGRVEGRDAVLKGLSQAEERYQYSAQRLAIPPEV